MLELLYILINVAIVCVAVGLVAMTLAFIDLVRRDPQQILGGSKILWVLIILATGIVGSIVYMALGRTRENQLILA